MAGWARERRRLLDRPRLPTCLPHAGEGHARLYRPWAWPCASLSSKPRAPETETVVFLDLCLERRFSFPESFAGARPQSWLTMAGAAGLTGFSACSRPALLPLRGTRRRGRSASSPLRTQTSSPTSCEGYEPRSEIARVPARLDAFVSRSAEDLAGRPRFARDVPGFGRAREVTTTRHRLRASGCTPARHVCGTGGEETDRAIPRIPFLRTKDPRVPEAQAVGNPRRVRADHRAHLRGREARHRG